MATTFAEIDVLNPATFADGPPHHFFDQLRAEDPVHRHTSPLFPGDIYSLTRFKDIREVGNNTAVFSSAQGTLFPEIGPNSRRLLGVPLAVDPPVHTRLRGLVSRVFTPRVVAQFESWIREVCERILDDVMAARSFDAIPMIASELPAQVIASILGVPEKDRQFIIRETPDLFGVLDPDIGIERAHRAHRAIVEFGVELAELKRREPGVDMVTELINAVDEASDITMDEYRGMFLTLYTAGYETTHTMIAQSLYMMARQPEVAAQVQAADYAGMKPIVEEFLRLVCPVNYWGRIATQDTEIAGQPVAQGDYVMMWFTAANRDPAFFADPHEFRPGRERGRSHAAFGGGGPHLCVGAHLARLEGQILLDEMNKRGIRLEMDGEARRSVGIHINALRKLPMRIAN